MMKIAAWSSGSPTAGASSSVATRESRLNASQLSTSTSAMANVGRKYFSNPSRRWRCM